MKETSPKTTEILQGIAALVGILIVVVLLWWLFSTLINYVSGWDKGIASAIIAGLFTVFSLIFAFIRDRDRALKEAHREKKIAVYSMFFDMVFSALKRSKSGDLDQYLNTQSFVDQYMDFTKGVAFYASPGVISALSEWWLLAGSGDTRKQIEGVGAVLLAMRKDIGLSNFGLTSLSIHQVYVTDDLRTMAPPKATT